MKKQLDKFQVVEDVKKVSKIFKKEFPNSKEFITRDYYRSHGEYGKSIDKIFGSFKNALSEIFKDEKLLIRDDFDIKKNLFKNKKRFVISAIVPDQKVNTQFIESIQTYCEKNRAELLLLVMRGVKKDDGFSKDIHEKYSKYFITEATLNSNLKILDFLLLPQQIISLTGLDRIARSNSVIIAHTKQEMMSIPNRINEYPHLMYSTGVVTYPNYADDRVGKIAVQDHTMGCLVVEIVDNKKFHIHNAQCDRENGFALFGKYYKGKTVSKIKSNIILGDIHCGAECPEAIKQSKEMIRAFDCETIYFNDLFDGRSINHHEDKNMYAKYTRPEQQSSLQKELDYLGNFLKNFCKGFENKKFIVVPSNHDDFVGKWLASGAFTFDIVQNAKLGAELFTHYLDGENPIEYYLRSRHYIDNIDIHFATRNEELKSFEHTCTHGDKGINGAKGSAKSFDRCYDKNISAHSHSPRRFRSSVIVGTNSLLDQPYIAGSGSSWMHTNGISYENGTDQLVHIINGKWKLD